MLWTMDAVGGDATQPTAERPKHAFLWLEQRCNLRCNHCGIWRSDKAQPTLSLGERKLVVDRLRDWLGEGMVLNLLGGELLLLDDVYPLIAHCSSQHVATTLTTNGTLIDAATARRLWDVGLSNISVSLDSFAPAVHDETRGVPGTHARALAGIDHLLACEAGRPVVYVNALIMRQNLEQLPRLVRFVEERGLDGITFQPIAPPRLFGEHRAYDTLSRLPGIAALDRLAETLRQRDRRWYRRNPFWPEPGAAAAVIEELIAMQQAGAPVQNSEADLRRFIDYFRDPLALLRTCTCTACAAVTITAQGEIKHCASESSLGTTGSDDLAAAFASDAAKAVRARIRDCKRSCKILSLNKEDFYF